MWALARWLNAGTARSPYLLPFEPPQVMCQPSSSVAESVQLVLLTSQVNEAIESANQERARQRKLWGLDGDGE